MSDSILIIVHFCHKLDFCPEGDKVDNPLMLGVVDIQLGRCQWYGFPICTPGWQTHALSLTSEQANLCFHFSFCTTLPFCTMGWVHLAVPWHQLEPIRRSLARWFARL